MLICSRLIETLDGFQNERVDDVFVVIPIQAKFFEECIEFLVVADEGLVELADNFAVCFV